MLSAVRPVVYGCGCDLTRSRTCKSNESNAQGRPIGALWWWLHFACGGYGLAHSAEPWGPHPDRLEFRNQFIEYVAFDEVATKMLVAERKRDIAKDLDGEPINLP